MIPLHKPSIGGAEKRAASSALTGSLRGGGALCALARALFCEKTGAKNIILTTSCTHALELAALVLRIEPGDEIIMPSFTFPSTANAFMLRGARPVFCEIEPRTMNIDAHAIERLITPRTRAVVPVHYAGVPCDMARITEIARRHGLMVIEDAAQAVGSRCGGIPAGSMSDAGCYSFHETKNIVCGEGGGVTFASRTALAYAEILAEKGTNRDAFLRGETDRYTWREIGSSYLLSDVLAAILSAQLERLGEITLLRMACWERYHAAFGGAETAGLLTRPHIPGYASHNAHIYYIILPSQTARNGVLHALRERGIQAASHYEPLHASAMGRRLGYAPSDLPVTAGYAGRLLRLPLYADMSPHETDTVISAVLAAVHAAA